MILQMTKLNQTKVLKLIHKLQLSCKNQLFL